MAALQYADTPGYHAILFRRTFADLNLDGSLMDRANEWLRGTDACWNGQDHRWRFPSSATLSFGYLDHDDDRFRYKSAEYQFIGFDELTSILEVNYVYLMSRLRKLAGSDVPLRVRSATNPGDRGHDWVKRRFLPSEALAADEEAFFARVWYKGERAFVPARLEDNPSLDIPEYELSLAQQEPVTRAQLRKGDWKAHAGGRFRPEWWRRYRLEVDLLHLDDGSYVVLRDVPRVVIVDPANRKTKASKFTAIGVYGDLGGQRLACLEMFREQLAINEIIPALASICRRWSPEWVGIEANGFQIALVEQARSFAGMPTVQEMEPEGKSKLTRATPAIIRAEQRLFYLPVEAPWLEAFENEHQTFLGDEKVDTYTDQVDCSAYAVLGMDQFGVGNCDPSFLKRMTRR